MNCSCVGINVCLFVCFVVILLVIYLDVRSHSILLDGIINESCRHIYLRVIRVLDVLGNAWGSCEDPVVGALP